MVVNIGLIRISVSKSDIFETRENNRKAVSVVLNDFEYNEEPE